MANSKFSLSIPPVTYEEYEIDSQPGNVSIEIRIARPGNQQQVITFSGEREINGLLAVMATVLSMRARR